MYSFLDSRNNNARFATVKAVKFSLLSNDTIKRISSADVTNSDNKKESLKKNSSSIEQNITSALLGSTDDRIKCDKCKFKKIGCTGHSGNCTLTYPLIHPFHMNYAKSLLKSYCFHCSAKFRPDDKLNCGECSGVRYANVRINNISSDNIGDVYINADAKLYDGSYNDCIQSDLFWTVIHKDNTKDLSTSGAHVRILLPEEIVKFIEGIKGIDVDGCVIRELYIPSNNSRPNLNKSVGTISNNEPSVSKLSTTMADTKKYVDPITSVLTSIQRHNSNIVKTNNTLFDNFVQIKAIHTLLFRMLVEGSAESVVKTTYDPVDIVAGSYVDTSGITTLNNVITSTKAPHDITKNNSLNALKSQLEKIRHKQGYIRKNILGKRIHNMCRSVIVCNPSLPNDTIMIPMIYAKKLETTEIVTVYNIDRLRKMYDNTLKKKYPMLTKLTKHSNDQSKARSFQLTTDSDNKKEIAVGDIVSRDLIDGDVVLFNRQPSLLYSNITAFKVIVDPDPDCYVVSFNVTIAHFFNADFDGDQMSVIHLNDFTSRFEAINLSSANNFCISKQTSLANLGQTYDSIVGSFLSTRDNSNVSYYDSLFIMSKTNIPNYKELVDNLFKDNKNKIINCRELHSLVIPKNINLDIQPSWYNSKYDDKYSNTEKRLVIKNGKILSGTLDKNSIAIGAKDSFYRQIQYDIDAPSMLDAVFNTQQVSIGYVMNRGFTLGIRDIVIPNEAIASERKELVNTTTTRLRSYIKELQEHKITPPVGYNIKNYFHEMYMNLAEMQIPDIPGKIDFNDNNLFQLIQSGSKGKMSVMSQMTSSVGMIKIDGRMPPETYSVGRFLPYYSRYEMTPESYAFVKNSYYTGLTAPEFLPATMQSRLEIITKALMTAVSGEQNRNSIKALESNITTATRSVVNSHMTIQELYGGDGFDVSSLIVVNMNSFYNKVSFADKVKASVQAEYDTLKQYYNLFRKLAIKYQQFQYIFHDMSTIYKFYIPVDVVITLNKHINKETVTGLALCSASKTFEIVDKFCKTNLRNIFSFVKEADVVSNALLKTECAIRTFLSIQYHTKPFIAEKVLHELLEDIEHKIQQALINESNAIGIITAQCISEPITQQTLDTHHGAAQEGSKKTGMGRIKELIGSKDNSSQNMLMSLIGENKFNKELTEKISKSMETIYLSEIIKDIEIHFSDNLDDIITNTFMLFSDDAYKKPTIGAFSVFAFIEIDRTVLLSKTNLDFKNIVQIISSKYPSTYNSPMNSERLFIMIINPAKPNKIESQSDIISLIQNVTAEIKNVKIQGIEGISKTNVIKVTKPNYASEPIYTIVTNGVNILDICEKYNQFIDISTIQVDDMKLYNQFFGITATKEKLLYELRETIDSSINIKNYKLVADNICLLGHLTNLERAGIDKREGDHVLLRLGKSHFRQVLEDASHHSRLAVVNSLTASLMVGQAPKDFGTAAVKIDIDPMYLFNKNLKTQLEEAHKK